MSENMEILNSRERPSRHLQVISANDLLEAKVFVSRISTS